MNRPSASKRTPSLAGLPPAVAPGIRVLVLGSFPSEASLAAAQYYAHPRNQFWRLMAAITGRDIPAMDYAARVAALNGAGIGLWDVIGRCRRRGSLDGDIRDAQFNDFAALVGRHRELRLACFNGKTAARQVEHVAGFGLDTVVLPSSSPANTMPFDDKLALWRVVQWALES